MKLYLPLVIAATLLTGCDKKDGPAGAGAQPAPAQHQGQSPPVSPIPDRPAPDVPKGTTPELPKPGQVNNHSSPDFKGGGMPDRK